METVPAPPLVPAPAIAPDRTKPVIIRPPEVSAAHDFAVVGYILTLILSVPWLIIVLTVGGIGVAAYLGYTILPPVLPAYLSGLPFIGAFLTFLFASLPASFTFYIAFGLGGLIGFIIFLGAVYFSTVRNINKGRYERARNAALFFGVLLLIPTFFIMLSALLIGTVVAILPAFFFLLTYGRLGEVIAKYGPVAVMGEAVPGLPFAGPPAGPGPMPPIAAPMGGPPMGASPGGPMPPGLGAPVPPGPAGPPMQPLTGVAPRIPLCPGCGRELYYSANHRRWYCMTCDNPVRSSGLPRP
jgi:hypothetical protein